MAKRRRAASFTCSSDGPCDHWHLAEAQAKALSENACLPREDTDPTPDSHSRVKIGESTLTFWRFAICRCQVGGSWRLRMQICKRCRLFHGLRPDLREGTLRSLLCLSSIGRSCHRRCMMLSNTPEPWLTVFLPVPTSRVGGVV
jgi:hypothetical protein